jgi:hypothetical protein
MVVAALAAGSSRAFRGTVADDEGSQFGSFKVEMIIISIANKIKC